MAMPMKLGTFPNIYRAIDVSGRLDVRAAYTVAEMHQVGTILKVHREPIVDEDWQKWVHPVPPLLAEKRHRWASTPPGPCRQQIFYAARRLRALLRR